MKTVLKEKFAGLVFIFSAITALSYASAEESAPLYFSLEPPQKTSAKKFESEHAAVPMRKYWLSDTELKQPAGFLLQSNKSQGTLQLTKKEMGWTAAFPTPWGDESLHGPNNIYAVEKKIENDALQIRTAKWITIHHNCSWGHNYKYDKERLTPSYMKEIPLEIVPSPLWDGNFHVRTQTSDTLELIIYSYGQPVENAKVTVTTEKKWKKEMKSDREGKVRFQLIRDYYPKSWEHFHKTKNSRLLFTAEYEINEKGKEAGKNYDKIRMTSSLPWRYKPAVADYSSSISGLAVGGISFILTIAGIFFYRERRKKPLKEIRFNEKD